MISLTELERLANAALPGDLSIPRTLLVPGNAIAFIDSATPDVVLKLIAALREAIVDSMIVERIMRNHGIEP